MHFRNIDQLTRRACSSWRVGAPGLTEYTGGSWTVSSRFHRPFAIRDVWFASRVLFQLQLALLDARGGVPRYASGKLKDSVVRLFQPGGMAGVRASPPCRAPTENAHSAGLWRDGPALAQGPISCARARCRRAPHHNGAAGWAGKAHPAARGHSTLSWAVVRRRRQADATCRAPSGTMHTPRFGDPEGGPGAPAHFRALRERHGGTHQRFSCSSRQPGSALAGPQTQHRQCQWSLRSQHRHEVLPSGAPRRLHLRNRTSPDVSEG